MNYIYIAVALAVFAAGWQTRTWYEDSKDLAEQKATEEAIEAFTIVQRQVAEQVGNRLQELRANEKTIERWETKIVDRPVYNVSCIDDDGLRIISAYANGATTNVTPEKPANTTQ